MESERRSKSKPKERIMQSTPKMGGQSDFGTPFSAVVELAKGQPETDKAVARSQVPLRSEGQSLVEDDVNEVAEFSLRYDSSGFEQAEQPKQLRQNIIKVQALSNGSSN